MEFWGVYEIDFPEIAMRRPQGDPCNPVRSSLFHPLPGEEGNKMRKIMFLGLLVVFLPAMVSAQEKIDAPAWNVGDKWTFTSDGIIEVIKADQSGYTLKFSKRTCIYETQGYDTILFHKSSLNRLNFLEGDKQKKYTRGHKKLFDFPLSVGLAFGKKLCVLLSLSKKSKWPILIILAPLKINNLQTRENRKMFKFRFFRQPRYLCIISRASKTVTIC